LGPLNGVEIIPPSQWFGVVHSSDICITTNGAKKHQQHLTETHNLPIQVWIKNSILISNAKGVKHFVQATLHQGPKTLTLFYFDV
jgi:hypothetical protein